jgi:hypothetical protein
MNGGRLQHVKMQLTFQKLGTCTLFSSSRKKYPNPMLLLPLCLLSLTSFVISQDHPQVVPPRSSAANTPILVIHNICSSSTDINSKQEKCEHRVTRAEFDRLITALDPKMPESNRLALATEYVRLLAMAGEAERMNLDKTPEFKMLEDFTRLQLLERQLVRKLTQDTQVSDAEVAEAFQRNQKEYEEGVVRRIVLPKTSTAVASAQFEEAEKIRQRAIAGEDLEQLQREIWSRNGHGPVPATRMGPLRRSALPSGAQEVFDLKTGSFAPLIDDRDAYYIYKLESKTLPSLESVAPAIRGALTSEHLQARMRSLRDKVSISVNEDYFGALPKTDDLARHHGMQHGSSLQPMTEQEKKQLSQ